MSSPNHAPRASEVLNNPAAPTDRHLWAWCPQCGHGINLGSQANIRFQSSRTLYECPTHRETLLRVTADKAGDWLLNTVTGFAVSPDRRDGSDPTAEDPLKSGPPA